jgi:methionine synthase II (cobalamin-independent)
MAFVGNCRATGVGSLPYPDAPDALAKVFEFSPDLPYWPQLPRRSRAEGMTEQATIGLPGLVNQEGRLRLVQDDAFYLGVERLFEAWEAEDASVAALPPDSAASFEPFLAEVKSRGVAEAKGQIAGPVTVGMAILGEDGNPILYDDTLRDVLVKFLRLRVRWQADQIAAAGARPLIFVDEPFLASFGTPFFGWSQDQCRKALEAVTAGAPATGSHCCSNTDWTILLGSGIDAVSFDAYEFADNFLVYRDALAAFLGRGGNIAWGIVPTDPEAVAAETVTGLVDRMRAMLEKIRPLGFEPAQVLRQSVVTPACGLGSRDIATAERALPLVRDVAATLAEEFLGARRRDAGPV